MTCSIINQPLFTNLLITNSTTHYNYTSRYPFSPYHIISYHLNITKKGEVQKVAHRSMIRTWPFNTQFLENTWMLAVLHLPHIDHHKPAITQRHHNSIPRHTTCRNHHGSVSRVVRVATHTCTYVVKQHIR